MIDLTPGGEVRGYDRPGGDCLEDCPVPAKRPLTRANTGSRHTDGPARSFHVDEKGGA